ncbi:hypothetical protein QUB80_33750 [Chlorogloeopsis sp. ULAP01]|uniref:hypothetical protein n=1 Tax=Chlorogloeopsis sp. ULAP01 TaxID=3056483 RepID=UPI0025AA8B67|nr:hypothetical protein [Chlorogloeopsis sp. ULAP01]MDM9385622.1 hypothetical protein [Chlorogloeopsis sp. ULAP01]
MLTKSAIADTRINLLSELALLWFILIVCTQCDRTIVSNRFNQITSLKVRTQIKLLLEWW